MKRGQFGGPESEAGVTVAEVTIASAILLLALVGFFASLASLQSTTAYESGRTRALDDLRITAGAFAKDVRHAKQLTSVSEKKVVMETYVNGILTEVTYEVDEDAATGDINLQRTQTGNAGARLFVIKLTDESIFTYTPDPATVPGTEPEDIRLVGVDMKSRPSAKYPPVLLASEVLLRNVSSA